MPHNWGRWHSRSPSGNPQESFAADIAEETARLTYRDRRNLGHVWVNLSPAGPEWTRTSLCLLRCSGCCGWNRLNRDQEESRSARYWKVLSKSRAKRTGRAAPAESGEMRIAGRFSGFLREECALFGVGDRSFAHERFGSILLMV